ncbi:MAG: aldolase/citrate lyase family protein [Pseudomonadota bacterium]
MTTSGAFEMLLFHRDVAFSKACLNGGAGGLIVDLETRGKAVRQDGFDTQISVHDLHDLEAAKSIPGAHVLCRINGPGPDTTREVADVLAAGADEIIFPMIRHPDEAKALVDAVAGAARVTLMVETVEALACVADLCALPTDRIYVGLNDLQISLGTSSIFDVMQDGRLDAIRTDVQGVEFGFGGITLRGKGSPLPVRHLVGALARLDADFTFLRRSFYRDVEGRDPVLSLRQMHEDMQIARTRAPGQVAADHNAMRAAVQGVLVAEHG